MNSLWPQTMSSAPRVLLLSNSTVHGRAYLEHARAEIVAHLEGVSRVLFVPFALKDHDGYAAKAAEAFAGMGLGLSSIHTAEDMKSAVAAAQALFIGVRSGQRLASLRSDNCRAAPRRLPRAQGGNTFRLLNALYHNDLLGVIRTRVLSGELRYIGSRCARAGRGSASTG